jgi:hypothetical protein
VPLRAVLRDCLKSTKAQRKARSAKARACVSFRTALQSDVALPAQAERESSCDGSLARMQMAASSLSSFLTPSSLAADLRPDLDPVRAAEIYTGGRDIDRPSKPGPSTRNPLPCRLWGLREKLRRHARAMT